MKLVKRVIFILLGVAVVALLIIALLPSPVKVDVARADRGPLLVTIDEEGEARAHDRFVVAAPVAGRLERVDFHDGDVIKQGDVVAVIDPLPLDARESEEIIARVQAAESLKREAEERVEHARADYEQARRDRERFEALVEAGVVSRQAFEQAKNAETTGANELEAARFKAQAAASEVKIARAGLMAIEAEQDKPGKIIRLRSPVSGRVLRVVEKSERVVTAGAPLLVLGDPQKLEVVVDVLSTDAVKVKPGAQVYLEDWGGEHAIRARVTVVEASAFTKVSALGIEEQRVNIVADFIDPPGPLGDGYRVEARIVIWEGESVLKVPSSALFRDGEGWSLFVAENGKALRREVIVGHRSPFEAEIMRGLEEGVSVILHPTNKIQDGTPIKEGEK
jgi:HlyD family secretion protein